MRTDELHAPQLSGRIRVHAGAFGCSLIGLQLQSNQLTGTIPADLSALSALQELSLEGNSLTGM